MPDFELDQAAAREDLCRFLSACFYEPGPEFAEERVFDSMLDAARRIDPDLAELARRLGEDFAGQDVQTLLVDYARLFVGPAQPLARPDGSGWLGGEPEALQESSMAVLDLYNQGGFELDGEIRDVPDHIAVELEFLYLLTFKQNEAQRAGLEEALTSWKELKGLFLARHLGAWISPFAQAVKAQAQTAFYRDLADLAERFVRMEGGVPATH